MMFFLKKFGNWVPKSHGLYKRIYWLNKFTEMIRKKELFWQRKESWLRIRKRKRCWNFRIIWHRKIFGKCLRKVSRMWPQCLGFILS